MLQHVFCHPHIWTTPQSASGYHNHVQTPQPTPDLQHEPLGAMFPRARNPMCTTPLSCWLSRNEFHTTLVPPLEANACWASASFPTQHTGHVTNAHPDPRGGANESCQRTRICKFPEHGIGNMQRQTRGTVSHCVTNHAPRLRTLQHTHTTCGEVADSKQTISKHLDVARVVPQRPQNVLNHTGGRYPRRVSVCVMLRSTARKQHTKYHQI